MVRGGVCQIFKTITIVKKMAIVIVMVICSRLCPLFQIDEVFFIKGEEGPDDDVQGDGRCALGSAQCPLPPCSHFLPLPNPDHTLECTSTN